MTQPPGAPGPDAPSRVSRTISVALPSTDTAPGQARHSVFEALRDTDVRLVDDVLLVVSELVTNAVHHGGAPIELRVAATDTTVVVEVADAGSAVPGDATLPGPDALSGRGLAMVARACRCWGVRPSPPGKTVWAEIAL